MSVRIYDEALKGFGITVGKGGSASYFVEYRLGGRGSPSQRMTLGKHPNYYAAFVLDPDGHNVEAVCHQETE